MKAALLVGPQKVEIRELPVPVPREGEVLVRVREAGICGTDFAKYRGDLGGTSRSSPATRPWERLPRSARGSWGRVLGSGWPSSPISPAGNAKPAGAAGRTSALTG